MPPPLSLLIAAEDWPLVVAVTSHAYKVPSPATCIPPDVSLFVVIVVSET